MAAADKRSIEELRAEIGEERRRLLEAVATLRGELGERGVRARLRREMRARLPVIAAVVLGVGFVAGGGLRATVRLLVRRVLRRR